MAAEEAVPRTPSGLGKDRGSWQAIHSPVYHVRRIFLSPYTRQRVSSGFPEAYAIISKAHVSSGSGTCDVHMSPR